MLRSGLLFGAHLVHRRPPTALRWQGNPASKTSNRLFSCNFVLKQHAGGSDNSPASIIPSKAHTAEDIKPEAVQKLSDAKPDEAPKTDGLLAEQTVSNKEQRKADWAIMKEMVQYLWPKVGLELITVRIDVDPR